MFEFVNDINKDYKKLKLKKESVIYVLCPAFSKTGGTELLHQLVFALNRLGYNAYITYNDAKDDRNINPAFLCYTNKYMNTYEIIDDENNVIVIPETLTNYIYKYKKIKKYVWWESVDNYLATKYFFESIKRKNFVLFLRWIKKVLTRKKTYAGYKKIAGVTCNLVQSYYSYEFLKKHKINNVFWLSDYINDLYFTNKNFIKDDIICYNPRKGYKFTKKIISSMPDYKFVPIQGMSNEQVCELLSRSKVYIDFGNHPGKDRFPREARMMNCCIITGKNGSAKFYEDVCIADKYKFDAKRCNLTKISDVIKDCIKNYDENIVNFDDYKNIIKSEKDFFYDCVKQIFEYE